MIVLAVAPADARWLARARLALHDQRLHVIGDLRGLGILLAWGGVRAVVVDRRCAGLWSDERDRILRVAPTARVVLVCDDHEPAAGTAVRWPGERDSARFLLGID